MATAHSTEVRRIFIKNYGAQIISTAARLGSMALVSILVARYWGVETYGRYSAILAFVMLFKFSVDMGLQRLIIREISRDHDITSTYVSVCLYLILGMSVITIAAIFLINQVFGIVSEGAWILLLASLWVVLGIVGMLFSGVFYAYERMDLDTWTSLAEAVVAIGLIIGVLLFSERNLVILLVILAISRLVSVFVSVFIYRSLIGSFIWKPNPVLAKTTFLATIPFGLQILLGNYGNLHIVLLDNFHGSLETGIFKAAQALMPLAVTVGGLFGNVLYPKLSRAYQTSKEQFQSLLSKGVHYMLVSSIPMAIGMFLLADRIIVLIYGAEYEGSALYLRLLCASVPFSVMGSVLSTGLTSANRQGLRTAVLVLGLISNVLCGFWLIPQYRGIGAGLTHLLVGAQNFLLFLVISLKIIGGFYQFRQALPVLIASTLMTIFILAANRSPLFILISGGALVYGSTLFISDRVVRQDLHQIQFKDLIKSLFVRMSSLPKD